MKMILGVLGLLLAVAIVGSLARRQLQTVAAPSPVGAPASGVRLRSHALPKQVQQDLTRAMQAQPARNDAADR